MLEQFILLHVSCMCKIIMQTSGRLSMSGFCRMVPVLQLVQAGVNLSRIADAPSFTGRKAGHQASQDVTLALRKGHVTSAYIVSGFVMGFRSRNTSSKRIPQVSSRAPRPSARCSQEARMCLLVAISDLIARPSCS